MVDQSYNYKLQLKAAMAASIVTFEQEVQEKKDLNEAIEASLKSAHNNHLVGLNESLPSQAAHARLKTSKNPFAEAAKKAAKKAEAAQP